VSHSSSVLQAPATRALLIQVLSFFLVVFAVVAVELAFGGDVSLPVWALLQGVFAAALSRWAGLASWWVVIQFLFPGALVVVQAIQLPPQIFLVIFLVFLALYWTTFRTQVPFYPSTRVTWEAVAGLLPKDRSIRFIDIGSGVGGLVLYLAVARPESQFVGVELAPLPWLISVFRARVTRSRGYFLRSDYLELDFAEYDVVFAFLSPAAMSALWIKARKEMQAGSLLFSYEFPIPNAVPEIALPPDSRGAVLYGWRM
jgi:SAM-dependent methyltransferase